MSWCASTGVELGSRGVHWPSAGTRNGRAAPRPTVLLRAARVVVATLVAGFTLVAGPAVGPADAATVDDAITKIFMDPADPKPGEKIRIDLEWAVPDSASAGDTFTLTLSGDLRRVTMSFPLLNAAGDVVATAVVDDGLVTFTLTDFVSNASNVHGTAFFWAAVSHDVQPGTPITVYSGEESATVTVATPGEDGSTQTVDRTRTHKYGAWWDPVGGWDGEGGYIGFAVESPTAPEGGLDEVTIVDALGPGMEYICEAGEGPQAGIFVFMSAVDDEGRLNDYRAIAAKDLSVTCAATTLTIVVRNVPAGFLVRTEYGVKVVDHSLDSYSNSVSVTAGQVTQEVEVEVIRSGAGGSGGGDQNHASVTVSKSADPPSGTVLTAGQTVTYTLDFSHTGTGAAAVDFTDHLRDVLDDADFGVVVDAGGLSVEGPTNDALRITGSITKDTSVRYTVTVKGADRGDDVLRNVVVAGTKDPEPQDPGTEHPVRYVYLHKTGDGLPLDGAEFVLRADVDGSPGAQLTTPTLTAVPAQSGWFVTGAIDAGAYWLEERRAPDGFELLAAPVRFVVAVDGAVTLTDPSANPQVTVSADREMSTITVDDRRAYALPLTGGTGSAPYWLVGGVLLAVGAAVALVRRRPQRRTTFGR